jgi:hypothetical protein
MKSNYGTYFSLMGIIALLTFCGCDFSRPDLHVSVSDTKGLAKGSPVIWQDAYVGQISGVSPEEGRYRVHVTLQKPYRKTIRAGVKACPLLDKKISEKPILFLIGGKDPALPLLAKGSQIQEASLTETAMYKNFWSWLGGSRNSKMLLIGCLVAVVVGFVAFKILKGLLKIVIIVGAILIVIFSSKTLSDNWATYKASWNSAEVKQWLSEHMKDVEQIRNLLPRHDASKTEEKK